MIKQFLIFCFVALAVAAWSTGILFWYHIWFWFGMGIAAILAVSVTIHLVWPKPEPPKPLDRTEDLRDKWRGKE